MSVNSKKITLAVGIPAYNEEKVIFHTLEDVLHQKFNAEVDLQAVYIISDGSSDSTVSEARKISSKIVSVIDGKDRQGKPARMNEIFALSSSDYTIVMDADIQLKDNHSLQKLVNPVIMNPGTDLISARVYPFEPTNFIQQVAKVGVDIWETGIKINRSNMYFCGGPLRLFSRDLVKSLRFPQTSADDVYAYIYASLNNFSFKYVDEILGNYLLPSTLSDYIKQSKRFLDSRSIQIIHFGKEVIRKNYTMSFLDRVIALLISLKRSTIFTLLYLLFWGYISIDHLVSKKNFDSKWQMIDSTKNIERNT